MSQDTFDNVEHAVRMLAASCLKINIERLNEYEERVIDEARRINLLDSYTITLMSYIYNTHLKCENSYRIIYGYLVVPER